MHRVHGDGSQQIDRYEAVNHPDHYNWLPNDIECIDVSEHFTANLGSAIEYIWRNGHKPGVNAVQDLRKAIFRLEREIRRIEKFDK